MKRARRECPQRKRPARLHRWWSHCSKRRERWAEEGGECRGERGCVRSRGKRHDENHGAPGVLLTRLSHGGPGVSEPGSPALFGSFFFGRSFVGLEDLQASWHQKADLCSLFSPRRSSPPWSSRSCRCVTTTTHVPSPRGEFVLQERARSISLRAEDHGNQCRAAGTARQTLLASCICCPRCSTLVAIVSPRDLF